MSELIQIPSGVLSAFDVPVRCLMVLVGVALFVFCWLAVMMVALGLTVLDWVPHHD